MKIFITGATGFIGKYLVNKLVFDGHNVTVNLFQEEKSPFTNNVKTYKIREKDIQQDIDFFLSQSFDGIIHLASLYITNHRSEDVRNIMNSNITFGAYILECAVKSKIAWFINTGTFWQHYQNKTYSPVNLYAASKQAFESIAQYYIDSKLIKFSTLKLSDTFGPNDTRKKIFNIWLDSIDNGDPLDMSSGNQIIDISYIDDIIEAYICLMKHIYSKDFINGDTFAVKSNEKLSLKKLAEMFQNVTGKSLNINWGGRPYRNREVMQPWENGRTVPGWKQKVSIKEGINKTFNEK